MNSQFRLVIVDVTFGMVLFLTPVVVLFWRLPRGTAQIPWCRFFGSIGGGWLLLNLHRWFIELPVLTARAAERFRVDPEYFWDPASGNVITFLFAWIPVLMITVVYSFAALLWWRFRKRYA